MRGRRVMKVAALGVVLLSGTVVASALAESEQGAPPKVVRSPDGRLKVTLPRGATPRPQPFRIRTYTWKRLTAAERAARERAVAGSFYEVVPAVRLRKPGRITLSLPGFNLDNGVPALLFGTRTRNGSRWTRLGRQIVRSIDGKLTLEGTSTRLAQVAAFDTRLRVIFEPTRVERVVGESFSASFRLESPRADDFRIEGVIWFPLPSNDVLAIVSTTTDSARGRSAEYVCKKAGQSPFSASIGIKDSSPEQLFANLFSGGTHQDMSVGGTATCTDATISGLTLHRACAVVDHVPSGANTGSVTFRLGFNVRSLPPNPVLSLRVAGLANGATVTTPINPLSGRVDVKLGMTQNGQKVIITTAVNGENVRPQLVQRLGGPFFNVEQADGVVAGSCP
ncbi:MAG: hypothetical protein M3540_12900 [Actinomycetota bacterium]|nr:hypothetical protein [Actinomycetota bacterium]